MTLQAIVSIDSTAASMDAAALETSRHAVDIGRGSQGSNHSHPASHLNLTTAGSSVLVLVVLIRRCRRRSPAQAVQSL